MKSQLLVTPTFKKFYQRKDRIIINEGSSRSSKTYSICQILALKLVQEKNILITIVRKTFPSLKSTAYKDMIDVLKSLGIYDERFHNKSDHTIHYRTNEVEFVSVDDNKKVKGRKRDYLFMNEANELNYDDYVQLAIRTTKQIYMDYNPSHDQFHWIEEKIKTRDDIFVAQSTYKDNPFNSNEVIMEIERLKEADPNLWRIYGLGLMGLAMSRIYSHIGLIDEMRESYNETFYSLDFGFNHPTSLNLIGEYDDCYDVDELIYESGLTNDDLIKKLGELKVDKNKYIFCDSAEPARIEAIRRAGYNAVKANKEVKDGIDTVKSKKVNITKRSINLLKESRGYSWKCTTDGKILDEPVKFNDDGMDSMRYGIHTYITNKTKAPNIRIL